MERASHSEYWLHWQALLCEFIVFVAIVVALFMALKCESLWKSSAESGGKRKGIVYDEELWRPCWKTIHPAGLLTYRALVFLCTGGLLAADVLKGAGVYFYMFYTEWTFTLVIIYFALATLISAKGCSQLARRDSIRDRNERSNFLKMDQEQGAHVNARPGTVNFQSHQEWEEQKRRAGFLGYVMLIIFQTCAGAVVMTDIVFWLIIVPFLSTKRFSLNLLMGSMHSVNAFLLLIDAALNSMRFPWFRGAYFVLWTAAYVIFQWIIHACGFSWWPYPFLELSTPWAPLWYFSLAIVCIICYGIFALLIKLKERLFPKWFPYSYQCLY